MGLLHPLLYAGAFEASPIQACPPRYCLAATGVGLYQTPTSSIEESECRISNSDNRNSHAIPTRRRERTKVSQPEYPEEQEERYCIRNPEDSELGNVREFSPRMWKYPKPQINTKTLMGRQYQPKG